MSLEQLFQCHCGHVTKNATYCEKHHVHFIFIGADRMPLVVNCYDRGATHQAIVDRENEIAGKRKKVKEYYGPRIFVHPQQLEIARRMFRNVPPKPSKKGRKK